MRIRRAAGVDPPERTLRRCAGMVRGAAMLERSKADRAVANIWRGRCVRHMLARRGSPDLGVPGELPRRSTTVSLCDPFLVSQNPAGSAGRIHFSGDACIMRRFLSLSLLLVLPMFVACDDDPSSPDDTSHVGVYQLVSVDGEEVPFTFEEEGETITVLEGAITLNANGSFTWAAELEITVGEETTTETDGLAGTYTRSGNTVTFEHGGEDVGFETATLSGDVLTTTGGGDEVLVFEK